MDPRRHVPRTDLVLADPRLTEARGLLGDALVKKAVAHAQDLARRGTISPASVADTAVSSLPPIASTLTPVINATGVIVHTNLGRAPLSAAAREAVRAAAGCTDVEFDLESGKRSRRGAGTLDALAGAVPAAGAVHLVNNNAAALVLAATALAAGREIIVSRGELIEIGDGFRLPDLLQSTGARIREVGTTNRTSLEDYRRAVGADTAFILKVHPSNYLITGFTASVSVGELADLGILVVGDIGSGLLRPSPVLPDEPDADSWLRAGAGLVTASADKLLGGPQAGLLLGQPEIVTRLARHPLARALRVDKLTLAGLEATLAGPAPPVAQALTATSTSIMKRVEAQAERLADAGIDCRTVPTAAAVGGGGGPGVTLPSAGLSLPDHLASDLRSGPAVRRGDMPAVVGRIESGRLLLDLRSVAPTDDERLTAAILAVAGQHDSPAPAVRVPAVGIPASERELRSWREGPAKRSIVEFVAAVTTPGSADFVAEPDRIAVFDNDGTLWTEQPIYAQLAFALDRAAELGHPTSLDKLQAGGMPALVDLVTLTHAGITTEEFEAVSRRWLAVARHPRFDRPFPAMVYQPMLELLGLLDRNGFSCWIFSGGGTDFMRAFASEVYGLPPHRVIGSVGGAEFRVGPGGPELVKSAAIQVINDGPQKPVSIHTHIGRRPILAAGNTDGDLAMLQWAAASPRRTLQLVVHHTDGEREYAYDRDPILGSGTDQILAAAADHNWAVIDMAADWSAVYPSLP